MNKTVPSVSVTYARNGASTKANALGMRPMQERVFENFVYLLGNIYMRDLYKIGCTERSPARRAAEISKATGVPQPYDVICFWEGENFQQYERELHAVFSDARVNENREFFSSLMLHELVAEIEHRWEDEKHSFCVTKIGEWYLREDSNRGTR